MCLFMGYLYVLCGHIDYDISIRCVQSKREPPHITNPDILAASNHDDCIPHHPEPENGVAGNVDQIFLVSPDEIGPTAARWGGDTVEDDDADDFKESFFQSHEMANNRPIISGLCGTCTAAARQLIEMHRTRPYFGLAEEMVLDDDVAVSTDNDNNINAGMMTAQIDMHNAWANDCAGTSNDCPPISDTNTLWSERNFVKNFDLLDDPFAIHGENNSLELPVRYNEFLTNVMRVMDDDNDNTSISNYLSQSRLSRTRTTNLVLRPKKQQMPDKKRKKTVTFDIPSTASPHAAASAGELPHQDKKRKTSTVPDDCPYALRSRPSISLASGL